MTHLPILFGYHASNLGNSHVPMCLAHHWNAKGRKSRLYVPSADDNQLESWLDVAMTGLQKKLVYRLGTRRAPQNVTAKRFKLYEKNSPVVYLWAGLPLEVFRYFKDCGAKIILERINCPQEMAKARIDAFRSEWGLAPSDAYPQERLDEEREKLELASMIFCPSPMVMLGLQQMGIAPEKLASTSYGWSPSRFKNSGIAMKPRRKRRFLFVGSLCVRKGIPLLLEAWKRANPDAELVLVGMPDRELEPMLAEAGECGSIKIHPYAKDISSFFRDGDVFVFPTLEEGGPLVTYEAMAHGMIPLVSPMGAGAIVQNGVNGLVMEKHDVEAWAQALDYLSEPSNSLSSMHQNAWWRAQAFTWERVAEQRAQLIRDRFPEVWRPFSHLAWNLSQNKSGYLGYSD